MRDLRDVVEATLRPTTWAEELAAMFADAVGRPHPTATDARVILSSEAISEGRRAWANPWLEDATDEERATWHRRRRADLAATAEAKRELERLERECDEVREKMREELDRTPDAILAARIVDSMLAPVPPGRPERAESGPSGSRTGSRVGPDPRKRESAS